MNLPFRLLLTSLVIAFSSTQVRATTVVGGLAFADNAFADTLLSSSGSYTVSSGSLASVLIGSGVDDYAYSFDAGAYVQLGFTDNRLVNGPGADLALFELGTSDTFRLSLTIGGVTHDYLSVGTGGTGAGFNLNVAQVNLDDYGLASGAQLSSVVVGMGVQSGSSTVPSLTVVGALNSAPVPEPTSFVVAAIAFVGLVPWGRWRSLTA